MKESRFPVTAVTVSKYLALLLFAGWLVFTGLTGRVSSAPMEDVAAAVTEAAELAPMSPGDNQMLRRLYGLEPDTLGGVLLYYPTSSMSVEELCLIRLSDVSQQDAVRQAMEDRIAAQLRSFDGYGPDQAAELRRAVVEVRGNYALLVVAEDPAPVLQAFRAAL